MADDGVNEQRPWIGGTGRTELAPYVDQVASAPRVDPAARPCRVACPGWRDVLDVSAAVADAGRMDEGVRSTAAETASSLRGLSRRSTPAAEHRRGALGVSGGRGGRAGGSACQSRRYRFT